MGQSKLKNILLRLAPAFIFVTFGIWEIIQPGFWTGFVPTSMQHVVPIDLLTLIKIHGAVLLIVGIAFLIGKWTRYVAIVATLILLSICYSLYSESGFTDILVRDITITLFTASLIFN